VFCTAFIDGLAVGTYVATGSLRERFVFSLPAYTYGKTIWSEYNSLTPFKHYYASGLDTVTRDIEYIGDPEPDRVTLYRTGPFPFQSSHYFKTWQPQLAPLGNAVAGTLFVDDIALTTQTFTGTYKQWFTVGLDLDLTNAIETGSRWEAIYSGIAGGNFKHYLTQMESEPKPFGKTVWAYSYRKLGGASQVDVGRYFSLEIEAQNPCTVQYWWDCDGTNFTTGTLTLTGGIEWFDRVPLPPGMRGYLFLFRLQAGATPVKIYKANLDLMQEGIKHLVRREVPGTPQSN
jgi:hypothetical protein